MQRLHRLFHIMNPNDACAVHRGPHGNRDISADALADRALLADEFLHDSLAAGAYLAAFFYADEPGTA